MVRTGSGVAALKFGRVAFARATPVYCTHTQGLQVQRTCMAKRPFTTRIDEAVLALAQRLAEVERRSVTSVIELSILEYAERRGIKPEESPRSTP